MAEPAHDLTPPIPFSNTPALATADVISLAEVAAKRAAKFAAMIDTLEAGPAARAAEVGRSLENVGMPRRDVEAAVAKAQAAARTEVARNSADARWGAIRELVTSAESLDTTAALWASPVTVLSRAGLGTDERTNFMRQLEGAGAVELTNMAVHAAATGNKVLGAAIISIIDRMPRKDRPFSAAELADKLVGPETKAVNDAIAAIRNAAQRAIVRNREFEQRRVNPIDRVKMALNNKEA
ncbi:MAG: hypothetical protein JNN06_03275 [Gemmobacter sp.]|uniref:hypothetical protein n=1 Tax=Gemmobacter sp. TaxID=1898957 RepID=UPI001A5A505E|nr:hypothetical protein [Gemmobacter sp.]MBL8561280.1 hypothetical protein [Gemmobacter sp.]